jgi:DNA-directed RNA polymerase subunit RPC12/RpoP
MQTVAHDCPNCSAPLKVPLGEVETGCEYCGSRLKILPGENELEVVRTREEMKRRERVDVQRLILQQKLQQEELARWRETAGRVAIAVLPVVGRHVARGVVSAAIGRGRGGCAVLPFLIAAIAGVLAAIF